MLRPMVQKSKSPRLFLHASSSSFVLVSPHALAVFNTSEMGIRQAQVHATLAHHIAETLPGVSVLVRTAASRIKNVLSGGEVAWPPADAVVGA
jgi:hypothetical protein